MQAPARTMRGDCCAPKWEGFPYTFGQPAWRCLALRVRPSARVCARSGAAFVGKGCAVLGWCQARCREILQPVVPWTAAHSPNRAPGKHPKPPWTKQDGSENRLQRTCSGTAEPLRTQHAIAWRAGFVVNVTRLLVWVRCSARGQICALDNLCSPTSRLRSRQNHVHDAPHLRVKEREVRSNALERAILIIRPGRLRPDADATDLLTPD